MDFILKGLPMIRFLQMVSRWLANYTSVFIIGVAVITFLFPHIFDWVRGNIQTIILGVIMLTMGLTLTTQDFKILARRPLDIFIGACAQFIIMPGVAYLLVHVWHLESSLALGILLVGCCPGGVSSNIMSYLCHGDVAFSVGRKLMRITNGIMINNSLNNINNNKQLYDNLNTQLSTKKKIQKPSEDPIVAVRALRL